MKNLLCAALHPGSANSIGPVIKELLKSEDYHIKTLAYGPATQIFSRLNIPFEIPRLINVSALSCVIDESQPNLILTGTSDKDKENPEVLEQNLIYCAKNKVTTLAVADIWKSYSSVFSEQDDKFKYYPNLVAVMNEHARITMTNEGYPQETIRVTGNPHFDEVIKINKEFKNEDRTKIRSELNIKDDAYVIMFASQPIELAYGKDSSNPKYLGYTEKDILKDVVESINKTHHIPQKLTLFIKVHPREKQKELEDIIPNSKYPVIFNQECPPIKATLASDMVISAFSTMLYESTLLDKPSVSYQPGLIGEDQLLTNSWDVTIPIYQKKDLIPTIEKIINDLDYQQSIKEKRKSFSVEENATQNVLKLIYQQIS